MRLAPFSVLLGLAGAPSALAHHDTAVQQVGAAGDAVDAMGLTEGTGSRVEVRGLLTWQSFGQLRQGTNRYGDAEPTVTVERYTVSAGARFASGTRLDLALPTGRIRGVEPGPFGLGDVTASVAQDIGPLRIGVLGVAPTGRYTVDAVASVVDVAPDADGGIGIVTYDARASLGGGTYRTGAVASVRAQGARGFGVLRSTAVTPIGTTPDGIRWGTDLVLDGRVGARVLAQRLSVGVGLQGLLHTADRIDGEPDAETGEPTRLRTSRRRTVALVGTIGARLTSGFTCGTQARLPLVQWVQGVQLAESFTVSAQCTVARRFGRVEPG